jgi:3-hydroxybutyryl-CoA dehydrogenase
MPDVAVVGPGRMGIGIAQALVLAGRDVALVDVKDRSVGESEAALETARARVDRGLALLASIGVEPAGSAQVAYRSVAAANGALAEAAVVFEAVPETRDAKEAAYRRIAASRGLVGSTTSTFGVDELAAHVSDPSRFMNTHWLNPAPLMPLVEMMPGAATSESAVEEMDDLLRALGKTPVRCKASAGYIVPRIQALAMNEAARLVEEGVATAEDVDTACRLGFGVRFATLGLLYASNYLSGALGSDRYAAPDILAKKVETGGLFRDLGSGDLDEYRREKLREFVALLEHLELR